MFSRGYIASGGHYIGVRTHLGMGVCLSAERTWVTVITEPAEERRRYGTLKVKLSKKEKSLYCPINSTGEILLYSIKCIAEGFDKVVNIFDSYRKPDSVGLDPLIEKLFFVELRMCCRSGVDNERLNICNICEQ